jgi:CubicO group peptidase (beta-lactamase class C family)
VNLAGRTAPLWGIEQSRTLGDFIQHAMQECLVPGVAIAVVQNGTMVFAEGFGVREIGHDARVTSQTRFMIGSSTKPLTTLMMARLIDQGAFTWSTPVTDLLPNFSLADPEVTGNLQMRHTVCACTGMPRRDVDFVFRFKGVTPEQRLEAMRDMRPTTGFGETFQYSNLLVAVGGYAAAATFWPEGGLQEAYDAAMKNLVFEPLGMASSFLSTEKARQADFAYPHGIDFEERCVPIDLAMEGSVESVAPAGGAWSTVEDMAQYLLLELSGGVTRDGTRLLSEETLRSRWSGGIRINDQLEYGLGLLHSDEQGLQVYSHGGNTFGFTSEMFFLPEQGIGAVILTNRRVANAFLGTVKQRLFEILFGAERQSDEMVAASVKNRHDSAIRTRERVKIDAASIGWIGEFVGEYESPVLGEARIRRNGEEFWMQFESWGSSLGSEIQADGARVIVLISAPWTGSFRIQTVAATGDLLLDTGQEKYTFQRQQL